MRWHNRRRDPSNCAYLMTDTLPFLTKGCGDYIYTEEIDRERWVLLCCKLIGEHTKNEKETNTHTHTGSYSSLFQVVFFSLLFLFDYMFPDVGRQAFTAQVDVFLFRLSLYTTRI